MSHANATLTPARSAAPGPVCRRGRLAAAAGGRTVPGLGHHRQRWADRYRAGRGRDGDRSSRPHRSPRRTPTRRERRIIKVRVIRRWGPARIADLLGMDPSTVHRVLSASAGPAGLDLDRPPAG